MGQIGTLSASTCVPNATAQGLRAAPARLRRRLVRQGHGLSILADGDIGENAFGDLVRIAGHPRAGPYLDPDGDGGVALALQPAEQSNIVAD